jgi:hypothetical protein
LEQVQGNNGTQYFERQIDVAIAQHPGAVNYNPGTKYNLDKGGHPCSFQIKIPFPREHGNAVNPDTDAAGTDAGTYTDAGTHTDADTHALLYNMNIDQVTKHLSSLVKDCNVCGFLVNWPISVQGRMGASCGQTMFTLDKLASSSKLFTTARPFAFITSSRKLKLDVNDSEDEWGRIVNYGRIKDDHSNMIYSSKDASPLKMKKLKCSNADEKESNEAEVIGGENCAWRSLQEFMREQWPDEDTDLDFHHDFHAGSASSNYHYDNDIFKERDSGTKMYV